MEGMLGYTRRNFMVPKPQFASFDDPNAHLAHRCCKRMDDKLRGLKGTINERFVADAERLQPLPVVPYDACDKQSVHMSSLSLTRYRGNDYSVPTAFCRPLPGRRCVHPRKREVDLSPFAAAPLIAFTATKGTYYGIETDGRISPRCGAYRTDQRADTQASCR